MEAYKLRKKIKNLIKQAYQEKIKSNEAALEYDELTKFPELKTVIVDLLTSDFDRFLESIDWVAPRPTTFRINLKNNQEFYLTYNKKSWIAQISGKKYYLLNLNEEESAVHAISRLLRMGTKNETEPTEGDTDLSSESPVDTETETPEEIPSEA
jgi:hypothetical protein